MTLSYIHSGPLLHVMAYLYYRARDNKIYCDSKLQRLTIITNYDSTLGIMSVIAN